MKGFVIQAQRMSGRGLGRPFGSVATRHPLYLSGQPTNSIPTERMPLLPGRGVNPKAILLSSNFLAS